MTPTNIRVRHFHGETVYGSATFTVTEGCVLTINDADGEWVATYPPGKWDSVESEA